ncbi:MAG: 50S ribosomal protein L21 [Deltaproteobacteria bacterium]|nr:50S ribosomal protein L21 [Deltaproteobacteria bacterium]
MYAIVQTGGKQYKVQKGSTLFVEKLQGKTGDTIELENVLLIGGDKLNIGTPQVDGARVKCKILAQEKAEKIIIFKYKRRKRYRKRQGHRQSLTKLEIVDIALQGKISEASEEKQAAPKTEKPKVPKKKAQAAAKPKKVTLKKTKTTKAKTTKKEKK